jgi:hypothetical protein
LLGLPRKELDVLLPKLEFVRLKAHQVLHEVGETLKSSYFCNAGMFSQQVVMPDGNVLEIAVIGKEGASAVPVVAGFHTAYTRTIVRIEAIAFRVETTAENNDSDMPYAGTAVRTICATSGNANGTSCSL